MSSPTPVRDAFAARRSHAKVTPAAPSHAELLSLVAVAANVADHGSLRPWRLIELRGEARNALGTAMAEAAGLEGDAAERLAAKPLRASLLIAVVASHRPSIKVDPWEQDLAAGGVAHALGMILTEAGWGSMWRSGKHTRADAVRRVHRLTDDEQLLGWLYVGGIPDEPGRDIRRPIDPSEFLSEL